MNNNFKFARPAAAVIGLMALLGTIPAFAADAVMEAPPAPAVPMEEPPLNTWTGPYAGVSLGYGFAGETEVEEPGITTSIDTDGFLLGGFAGYNYQVGNIVAGAEADIGYSWEEGSNAGLTSESGVEGSLRARLGYVVSPNILLYATAGGAAKDLEVSDGRVQRQQHDDRLDRRRRRRHHGDRAGLRPRRVPLHRLRQRHLLDVGSAKPTSATRTIASPSASA